MAFLFIYVRSAQAIDCSNTSPSGDLVITTDCSFSGDVNGVDAGDGATNSASLILAPGGRLTILAGQTIAVGAIKLQGGALVKQAGGVLKTKTPLWMVDQDADGYPADTVQYAQTTPPTNARRRNNLSSMTKVDPSDQFYCADSYNPNVTCNECAGGQLEFQAAGIDRFSQCPAYNFCNGGGQCNLYAKRVFVSSTEYTGNLGGLAGADQSCQTLADNENLGGTWKAWLSDSRVSASERLTHSDLPYVLVDEKTKVADNWGGLTSRSLLTSINQTEDQTFLSKTGVWTNTNRQGFVVAQKPANVCGDWLFANKARSGIFGKNNRYTSVKWTNNDTNQCNKKNNLYCFEQ